MNWAVDHVTFEPHRNHYIVKGWEHGEVTHTVVLGCTPDGMVPFKSYKEFEEFLIERY